MGGCLLPLCFSATTHAHTMNYSELSIHIENLRQSFANRNLEDYLLALYALLQSQQDAVCTPTLCLSLLQEAFTAAPAPFNEQWLLIRQMPDEGLKTSDPWQYACVVIIFQVAELHRMRGQELQNELRHYGITSETGYSWYNFDPLTLLECGAQGLEDSLGEEVVVADDWSLLGDLLDLGRYYE